ncbi:MAG: hypothetical protein ACREOG_08495 [Gemmatimonadaceae bacterium]
MPVPERYYREQIERATEAERRATRDTRRSWARAIGEVWFWTLLGLVGLAFALHTDSVERGWMYWWAGAFVWVAGVSYSLISTYRRGLRRGDWQ